MDGFAFGAVVAYNFFFSVFVNTRRFFIKLVKIFLIGSENESENFANKNKTKNKRKLNLSSYINFDVPSETIIATVIGGYGSLFWILTTLTAIFFTRITRVVLKKRYSTLFPFLNGISTKNLKHLYCIAVYLVIANSTISQANQILVFSKDAFLSNESSFFFGINPTLLSLLICIVLVYPNKQTIRSFLTFPSIITCFAYLLFSLSITVTSRINVFNMLESVVSQFDNPVAIFCGIVSGCSAFSHVIYSDNYSSFYNEEEVEDRLSLSEPFFEYLSAVFSCCITGAALIASDSCSLINNSEHALSFRKAEDAVIFSKAMGYMFKSKKTVSYVAMFLSFINLFNDSCYQHRYFGFGACEGSMKSKIIKKILIIMPIATMLIMRLGSMSVTPIIDATDILITAIITFSIPICFLYLVSSFVLKRANKLEKSSTNYKTKHPLSKLIN